jgi:hypothetical protein
MVFCSSKILHSPSGEGVREFLLDKASSDVILVQSNQHGRRMLTSGFGRFFLQLHQAVIEPVQGLNGKRDPVR